MVIHPANMDDTNTAEIIVVALLGIPIPFFLPRCWEFLPKIACHIGLTKGSGNLNTFLSSREKLDDRKEASIMLLT